MKSSPLILVLLVAFTSADVSHLANRYLPPNHYHQSATHRQYPLQTHQNPNGPLMNMPQLPKSSNERVETIIEKHEVVELPTQVEIVKEGQPIYGIQPQAIMAMAGLMNDDIRSRYLPPMQEFENLQPPQVPYEMPMRTYLPPVPRDIDTKTTQLPETTTTMAPITTTNMPSMEETTTSMTTELPTTTTEQEMNNFDSTTTANDMPTTEPQTMYDTTTQPGATTTEAVTMPENRYLPPPAFAMEPANRYLPPSPMMLPPYEAMPPPQPQPNYQQYNIQLMSDQQMQEQMYRQQEMQEMMQAISQMEQQRMIALDQPQEDLSLQQQPIAPVEPAHVLRPDGYHYKTVDDDSLRKSYRYRH